MQLCRPDILVHRWSQHLVTAEEMCHACATLLACKKQNDMGDHFCRGEAGIPEAQAF